MPTYLSAGFTGRDNLGKLLNKQNLTNLAVEVGTHQGAYANRFLQQWEGKKLYCIDPWTIPKGYEKQAKMLMGQGENRDRDFELAKRIATIHKPRMELIKDISENAVKRFEDNSLDFVYVDGDHLLPAVTLDFKIWFPKVKPGGVFAGHDIVSARKGVLDPRGLPPVEGDWGRGVRKVLWELAEANNMDIYLIADMSSPWSYFCVKP